MTGLAGAEHLYWSADTDAVAFEVLGTEMLDNISHSIMSSGSGRKSDLQSARGDIKIIMDDDKVAWRGFVEVQYFLDSSPRVIHEEGGFSENYLLLLEDSLCESGKEFTFFLPRTLWKGTLAENIERETAGVVTSVFVGFAWITKADDYFHSFL